MLGTNCRTPEFQKNPFSVRKIFVRNSGAGNGCQFYGRLEKCVLSAGKTMSIKFLVLGGGVSFGFFWGGSADFIFMGARIFLKQIVAHQNSLTAHTLQIL